MYNLKNRLKDQIFIGLVLGIGFFILFIIVFFTTEQNLKYLILFSPFLIMSIMGVSIGVTTIIKIRKFNYDINNKVIKKFICSPLKIKILYNYNRNNKSVKVIGARLYCNIDDKIKKLESYFSKTPFDINKIRIKKYEDDIQKSLHNLNVSYYANSLYIINTNNIYNVTKNTLKNIRK